MQQLTTNREEIKTAPARRGYPWSPEELDRLKYLFLEEGRWPSEIATALHRTLFATDLKIKELGLTAACRRERARYKSLEPAAQLVSGHFGVSVRDMRSECRTRKTCWPRQVAMWLAMKCGCGCAHTGRFFGRDHTTTLHAWRKIEALRASSDDVRELTDALLATLQENAPAPPPEAVPEPEPISPPETQMPASEAPGAIGEGFYLPAEVLEAQEARFRAAMLASGEWP